MRLLKTTPILEGASGEICVILESQNPLTLGFNVAVTLTITSSTAGRHIKKDQRYVFPSANFFSVIQNDFMSPELQNIIFPAESVVNPNIMTCFSVNTGTDSAVEGDEEFVVSVIDANGDPADTVLITAPSIINVVIQDNTGKFQSQNFPFSYPTSLQ